MSIMSNVNANSSDGTHVYPYVLAGLEVYIKNPLEAYPNQTISINVTAEAAVNLTINYLIIVLHTFNNSTMTDERFYNISYIPRGKPKYLSGGESLNETSYEVEVPKYASKVIYGKIMLEWVVKGSEESTTYTRAPTFIAGFLRNPDFEKLKKKVPELEQENARLRENITKLNETLTDAFNNLTDFQNRYEVDLGNTRNVITILAITTVFFVATTAYLYIRKPKHYF